MKNDIIDRFKKFEISKYFGLKKSQNVCFYTGNINYLTYKDESIQEYATPCTIGEFINLFESLGVYKFSEFGKNIDIRIYKSENTILFNNLLALLGSFQWRCFGETQVAISSNSKNIDKAVKILFVSEDELLFRYIDFSPYKEMFTSFIKKEVLMHEDTQEDHIHYTYLSKLKNTNLPIFNERTFYKDVELEKQDYTPYFDFQTTIKILNEEYKTKLENCNLLLLFRHSQICYECEYLNGDFKVYHNEIGIADIYLKDNKVGEIFAPGCTNI